MAIYLIKYLETLIDKDTGQYTIKDIEEYVDAYTKEDAVEYGKDVAKRCG
jgi:hypothetical protein